MGGLEKSFSRSAYMIIALTILVPVTHCLNLGLIAGDLKRFSSPVVVKKISKHSPVFINVNSGFSKLRTPLSLPKLPPKPPPLKPFELTKLSNKLPRSILTPKLLLPPILPILPPILPPLLPIIPKIPFLPILPLPLPLYSPLLSKLKSPLKPLSVPIIKKSPSETLESDLKAIKVPLIKNDGILEKLLDLKKKGSLTTVEYIKLKKLLQR